MKSCFRMLLGVCAMLAITEVSLYSAVPTPGSVERFLTAANADRALQPIRGQLEMLVRAGVGLSLRGFEPTPEQLLAIERSRAEILAKYQKELAWEAWKDLFVASVQAQLTQEELDGFLAYYAAPQGKTLPNRIPQVIQGSNKAASERLNALIGRLQNDIKQAVQSVVGPPKTAAKSGSEVAKDPVAK